MEFLKKLFNDDDYVVGLSGFKDKLSPLQTGEGAGVNEHSELYACGRGGNLTRKQPPQYNIFTPPKNLVFYTNTKDNFLLK